MKMAIILIVMTTIAAIGCIIVSAHAAMTHQWALMTVDLILGGLNTAMTFANLKLYRRLAALKARQAILNHILERLKS